MRGRRAFAALRTAISRANKETFRITHFSVQTDHIHYIVEGDDRTRLIRGIQGLAVRCARAFNRALGRRGKFWPDRYHAVALTTPRQVRNCIAYVLLNHCKHLKARPCVDPCSSGPWFSGWRWPPPVPSDVSPVQEPRTWLGNVGWWKAGGPIDWDDAPAPGPSLPHFDDRGARASPAAAVAAPVAVA